MALAGIGVADDCAEIFNELKLKHTKRYIVYKIEDNKKIVIEHVGDKSETYADFCGKLPETEPRYGVCDIEYESTDGRPQNKIVFFLWSPDDASVKPKMIYASSKDAIKKKLTGLGKEIQANDRSDVDFDTVVKNVR